MISMDELQQLENEAMAAIKAALNTGMLDEVDTKYLGRANGLFTAIMKRIPTLPTDERPTFGKRINESKARVVQAIVDRRQALSSVESMLQIATEQLDTTMPARLSRIGRKHVITQTADRVRVALTGLGFEFVDGPELETNRYNFDALNYPEDHPAMDEQNSFYVDATHLLRTQTTALQGRTFEKRRPPMRIATIGRCFRYEAVDATHSFSFHQVDAFTVGEGVSMAHLKGTLGQFARMMFGQRVGVRFRPDFFPFVEPGVDYSISWKNGWLELGGAGMIHPNILEAYGFDPERYSGFAFGLGIERIPMVQFGVDDLRLFLDNNLQFLTQFTE